MSKIVHETVSVAAESGGLLRIEHRQDNESGVSLGGPLVLDRSAAAWLAAQIDDQIDGRASGPVEQQVGPDRFRVYAGGSDWEPTVLVHNQRDGAAPGGGLYALAFSVDTARQLASLLRQHAAP